MRGFVRAKASSGVCKESLLSGYNPGLRGGADKCRACVGGFTLLNLVYLTGLIRVGLKSAVIGGEAMRHLTNFFGGLRYGQYGRISASGLWTGFVLVFLFSGRQSPK